MSTTSLPFCPKLAFLPQARLDWQNGQQGAKRLGGAAVAWIGKMDSSEQGELESLKGTLKRADVRKFSTVENFLRMRYKRD